MVKAPTKPEFLAIPENERLNRTLRGVAMFAFLSKPNTSGTKKFNADPSYEVTLLMDDKEADKARSYGLDVKEPTDLFPKQWIKLKRKVAAGKNAEQVRPAVVDSSQKPVPKSVLIGNGSEVICKFITGWPDAAKRPVAYLTKVMILDLVPYDGSSKTDNTLGTYEGFSIEEYLNSDEGDAPFDAE